MTSGKRTKRSRAAFEQGRVETFGELSRPLPAPTVPGEGHWSWESQAKQYPATHEPGVIVGRVDALVGQLQPNDPNVPEIAVSAVVDTMLVYDLSRELVGILCHYPDEIAIRFHGGEAIVLEEAGNVSMWVRPDRRRCGVGCSLLAACDALWHPNWWAQRYTRGGHALISAYLRQAHE